MEKTPKPLKEAFKISHAIRQTYTDSNTAADSLVDWLGEMADAWEFNHRG
jgi:hypothetical protein